MSVINEVVTVTTEEAMVKARRLAKEEDLLVGTSSGANLAVCLKVGNSSIILLLSCYLQPFP
jgi:cysteine synthase